MVRAAILAALFAVLSGAASGQTTSALHLTVTLTDAAHASVPVARHVLLISDNPATSAPRRAVTRQDGTADVWLRPGNYTVESDAPVVFEAKAYQWVVTIDVVAGKDTFLALTTENADVDAAPALSGSAAPIENDPGFLLPKWKDSVVAVWTPDSRASGFVIDATGLVVTSQRAIAGASSVEVQVTPSVKVAAHILMADTARDVAVLSIDPAAAALVPPISLDCTESPKTLLADGQKLVTIGAPFRGQKDASEGQVTGSESAARVADFGLRPGGFGGPVFNASGAFVGLSSPAGDEKAQRRGDARVVSAGDVCEVVRSTEATAQTAAQTTAQTAQRPAATRLPLEPLRPFPLDALTSSIQQHASLALYQTSSSDFEITFLTPVLVYAAQQDANQAAARGSTRGPVSVQERQVTPTDFGNWSDYFADVPAVLAVRVTPKLTESVWMTIARGAAYTQGASVPAIKHFKPGFSRLRVFCGDAEVVPIHPFTLEQRLSDTDAVREGLYVFEPLALGPQCKSVKLELYSEKDAQKADTRVVDPQLIERIGQDFAPYRDLAVTDTAGRP